MVARTELDEGWVVLPVGDLGGVPHRVVEAAASGGIPATVPGCVHTDLLGAGLIDDPYRNRNELDLHWIGRTDWSYRRTVHWDSDPGTDCVELVCDGLDTIATITLNGDVLASTANMHRRYRFDLTGRLRTGDNDLAVTFSAPEYAAYAAEAATGTRPGPNLASPGPFNALRKMACNFGWDWGPILLTSGIWKPIAIETWPARLAQVTPRVRVPLPPTDSAQARGVVHVQVEVARSRAVTGELILTADVAGAQVSTTLTEGTDSTLLDLTVPDVDLWWPHGHGAQALYPLTITLSDETAEVDRWERSIGFRSVELNTSADEYGSAFTLLVNGVPIFARGANWIPDDCFVSRVGPERYRARLEQSVTANIDLLRIWGGGLYETDDFYDLCDELGILVWQDFLFACAAYNEEALAVEVEAEARDNVQRLTPHPSLVLWNGNNENIWGHEDWGWKAALGDQSWGAGFYFDLLPRIVAEVDGTRPYWPGSPWSGNHERHPNDPDHGCMHIWDVWNSADYSVYRDYIPRFAAEYGWQAPATYTTLREAVDDPALASLGPMMHTHQKAANGDAKLATGLSKHFPRFGGGDEWLWATQLNQARAITVGITHQRSHRGRCMGSVVWQINDCWPVCSWAAIDGAGRPKPLYYAMQSAYAPHLLTIQPRDEGLSVVLVSEDPGTVSADVQVRRLRFDGTVLAQVDLPVSLVGRGAVETDLPASLAEPADGRAELLVATIATRDGDLTAHWFFGVDTELAYPRTDVEATATRVAGGEVEVAVKARSLVRDLTLQVDRADGAAVADRALLTLLPGESATVRVSGVGDGADLSALTRWPVLCTANDLIAGHA